MRVLSDDPDELYMVRLADGRYLTYDLGQRCAFPAPRSRRYRFDVVSAHRLASENPGATVEPADY